MNKPSKLFKDSPDWKWELIEGDSWGIIVDDIEYRVTCAHLGGSLWEWAIDCEYSDGSFDTSEEAVIGLRNRIEDNGKEATSQ